MSPRCGSERSAMKRPQQWKWVLILGASCIARTLPAQGMAADSAVYRTVAGRALHLHFFRPAASSPGQPPHAVLLFHGGGWNAGAPQWTFAAALQFADWGLVAIPVQYRLSQGRDTPSEALDDACAAFAWVRSRSRELGLSGRLVGYGVSAGGQLVSATSTVGCPQGEPGPEAMLLLSPALDLARDRWFGTLLRPPVTAGSLSPLEQVRPTTAPAAIVQGEKDVLTPLSGARGFCDRLRNHGTRCELNVYPGLGHLLTRNLSDQENNFDPDPAARADGMEKFRAFLRRLGL
jgi:acetyl esterase